MADENSTPASVSQPVVVPTIVVPVPAAAGSAPQGEEWRNMSPQQFSKRLAEAEDRGAKRLLKDLGIENSSREEAVKQAKEELLALAQRKQEEAEQKAALEILKSKASRADELEPVFKSYVNEKFASLSEAAQKFIVATTPDDSAARWSAVQKAIEAGLTASPASAPVVVAAPAEVKPVKPATTMAPDAPTAPKVGGELNPYDTWKELKASGQTQLAANYYSANEKKILKLLSDKF